MKEVLSSQTVLQEEQLEAEIDRLSIEIRAMLKRSQQNIEKAKRTNHSNSLLIAELERQFECGKN